MKKRDREIELHADLVKEQATCETLRSINKQLELQNALMISLLADIRFALGDDGKRMSDELVEYCRELRKDAERYNKLKCNEHQLFILEMRYDTDEWDEYIDQLEAPTQAPTGA